MKDLRLDDTLCTTCNSDLGGHEARGDVAPPPPRKHNHRGLFQLPIRPPLGDHSVRLAVPQSVSN